MMFFLSIQLKTFLGQILSFQWSQNQELIKVLSMKKTHSGR